MSVKVINDGCGLTIKSGIAIVAGSSALIAQYFKSGRWTEKTELDESTQRAIIINSCQHPQEKKAPDIYFGHWMVDLSRVIPVEGGLGVQIPQRC